MNKILLLAAALLCGCTGAFTMVAPTPPASFTRLGHAQAESCGAIAVLATAYNFIPIQLTGRTARAYEKAIALDPVHIDAHINLGRLLHEDGDLSGAEKHYRAALASDPAHPVAAFNLGVALDDLGRLADAAEAYRRAIELDPDNPDAHYNLAGILERQHDKAGAVRHLTRYRALTR